MGVLAIVINLFFLPGQTTKAQRESIIQGSQQLAIFSLSSKHGTPWAVFVGGSLALTLVTGLGVVGGQGLCRIVPERVLLGVSAAAFVVMGLLIGGGIL